MKYKEQEFTLELKENIQCMEKEIERISLKLHKEYAHLYIEKHMELDMGFAREKEMIEFHYIPIWKCERIFLGMSIQSNIFGSKKVGELVDESCYEIEEELKEQLEEYLE